MNPQCTFEGCKNRSIPKRIAGLCRGHRDQKKAGKELRPLRYRALSRVSSDGVWCPFCDHWLDRDDFYPAAHSVIGLQSRCKTCYAIGGREAALKSKYNLTLADYDRLLDAQNNTCAVCGADSPGGVGSWHVDHDHACCPKRSCGKCVRGLLCTKCNTGLGMFNDDPEILMNAISYLEGSNRWTT